MALTRIGALSMAAALALAGCGGGNDSGSSAKPASTPAASTPATTTAQTTETTDTTTQASESSGGLTPAGSTLKIGQPAVVRYTIGTELKARGRVEITPLSIEKGSIDDFKNIDLDAQQKASTPYYVKVRAKNVGPDLSGKDPAGYIDAVDDRGQNQSEVIFFGTFDRCKRADDPKSLKKGESYETCFTYLIPKGGSVTGMVWTEFDEKTGKSDVNWKM